MVSVFAIMMLGIQIWFEISAPLANSAMMSTLTVHYRWEEETVRDSTGGLDVVKSTAAQSI